MVEPTGRNEGIIGDVRMVGRLVSRTRRSVTPMAATRRCLKRCLVANCWLEWAGSQEAATSAGVCQEPWQEG